MHFYLILHPVFPCTVSSAVRQKIRTWREQNLSAGQIAECLSEDGIEISVRTFERVLREEGFPKLPGSVFHKLYVFVWQFDFRQ
jgi:hypothetical protein